MHLGLSDCKVHRLSHAWQSQLLSETIASGLRTSISGSPGQPISHKNLSYHASLLNQNLHCLTRYPGVRYKLKCEKPVLSGTYFFPPLQPTHPRATQGVYALDCQTASIKLHLAIGSFVLCHETAGCNSSAGSFGHDTDEFCRGSKHISTFKSCMPIRF